VKIKKIHFFIGLITLVVLSIIFSIPDFIPSLRFIQLLVILCIYILIIGLAYVIIMIVRNYFKEKYSLHSELLSWTFAMVFITILIVVFIAVSKNVGQDINYRNLTKEMNFPTHNVTLYVYDYEHKVPFATVKLKDKTLPVMHEIGFIENQRTSDLKIWRHNDTVFFAGKGIELFFDLKHRKAQKHYLKKQ
jgi:hypothetical protein